MTPGVSMDCALNSFMMSRNCAREGAGAPSDRGLSSNQTVGLIEIVYEF